MYVIPFPCECVNLLLTLLQFLWNLEAFVNDTLKASITVVQHDFAKESYALPNLDAAVKRRSERNDAHHLTEDWQP